MPTDLLGNTGDWNQFEGITMSNSKVIGILTHEEDSEEEDNDGAISNQESTDFTIFNQEDFLPKWIKLRKNLGYMRLRTKAVVMRYHLSNKKEGHEECYFEMMLFYPWRNEVEDLFRYNDEKCIEKYESSKEEITLVKSQIFPGEKALEIYDFDRIEQCRPNHF